MGNEIGDKSTNHPDKADLITALNIYAENKRSTQQIVQSIPVYRVLVFCISFRVAASRVVSVAF
jgi:hypothetical protein